MKKVLFVASVAGHINSFHLPYLKLFKENGYTVDVATQKETEVPVCDNHLKVTIERSPFKRENIGAYKQLKKLFSENEYDIVHCHTPVASILTRLAAREARKRGTKVIYTAHGFHFFKGAPLLNWLIYYPIEKLCARWTDVLITINKEDYALAKKKMPAKRVEYVPGVGIDLEKFTSNKVTEEERASIRKSLGLSENDKMLLSVGELNKNKNHSVIIQALARMNNKNIHYFIAGKGIFEKHLIQLAKSLGISENVHLLGYRTDIATLMQTADVFCFPSFREGLPVSLMEAMACGLPVVASRIRGNVDLIDEGKGGYLCTPGDIDAFAGKINLLTKNDALHKKMSVTNIESASKYAIETITEHMDSIYKAVCSQV